MLPELSRVGASVTRRFPGTINGSTITTHEKYLSGSYTSDSTDTFSTDSKGRLVASGTFTDSNGHHGSNSGTRISKPKGDICGETVSVSLTPDKVNVCGDTCAGDNAVKATVSVTGADGTKLSGENVALSANDPKVTISPVTDAGAGTYTATLHPSHTPGKVVVTATDNSATPAVSGSATLIQECDLNASAAGDASAGGSTDLRSGVGVRPDLNTHTNYCDRGFSYYASTALHTVGSAIGAAFVPIGGALVYVGAFTELPSAGASTIAVLGGLALAGAGVKIIRATTNAQDDPPDPHFTSLLAVPKVRALKLHAQRGLSARAAKALDKYATDLHKAGAVAGTLATTINRAGGAILAKDTAWEGRQIRYAIRLTQSFKTDIAAALKDARSLRRAAKTSPALTARLSAAMLRATQRKYRNRSVPGGVAKLLRPYGVSAGQLKTALKVKLPKRLPRNVLQFLTAQSTIADLQNAVKAFTAWSQVPQIVSESKLT